MPETITHVLSAGLGSIPAARVGEPSWCSCESDVEPGPGGRILVLHVLGDVDLATVPELEHALTEAADQHPDDLVVDLSGVAFFCVRGFALLADAAATAQSAGTGYAECGLSPHMDRIAGLLRPGAHPVRYRSAAAAVTAIRIEQTYRAS